MASYWWHCTLEAYWSDSKKKPSDILNAIRLSIPPDIKTAQNQVRRSKTGNMSVRHFMFKYYLPHKSQWQLSVKIFVPGTPIWTSSYNTPFTPGFESLCLRTVMRLLLLFRLANVGRHSLSRTYNSEQPDLTLPVLETAYCDGRDVTRTRRYGFSRSSQSQSGCVGVGDPVLMYFN